jgi:hypothetical protein
MFQFIFLKESECEMTIKLKPSYMEWTPNELADALRNWIGNKDQLLAAANMLQNQAQEIADLKTNISEHQQEILQLRSDLEDCTCQGGHSEAYLKEKGKL